MSSTQVDDAEGVVRANLESQITAKKIDAARFNLFTTAFDADGSGIDGLMDELKITVDPVNGYSFTDVDGNDAGITFKEDITPIAPPAPANAIEIATVSGAKHVLNGTYKTACYVENGNGKVDMLTINDGYEWINRSLIYIGSTTCVAGPGGVKVGSILATITKGSDKQITGWDTSPGMVGVPNRADGTGPISDTVTVTGFTLSDFVVEDPDKVFNSVPKATDTFNGFYVFDDTGSSGFAMYRDRNETTANGSDPYVSR